MEKVITSPPRLRGAVIVPGDKSISHRAAILGSIAQGEAVIEHFLAGADCLATLRCLRSLGVPLRRRDGTLYISGQGKFGLKESQQVLDAGNSGTTTRLLAGLLAGQPFLSIITGDASLRSRPMERIVEPLRAMGAQVWGRSGGTLAPLVIRGGALKGLSYRLMVASAQVKSALILAALYAEGATILNEPAPSRDHTERMLMAMGATLTVSGTELEISPLTGELKPLSLRVPGDISAAAFWMVAAAIHPDAELLIEGVGVNPTRTGIIDALREMGADITVSEVRQPEAEPIADMTIRSSRLRGIVIQGNAIPRLIDEIPVLAVAAALAEGETIIRDAAELRVKESDRLTATVEALTALGAEVKETPDGMVIRGVKRLRGIRCHSQGDHRLAMSLAVAGLNATGEMRIQGAEVATVSYPGFWDDLNNLSSSSRNTIMHLSRSI